ncbi:MAG: hypothetical protein RI947_464 [Candidatus Parcubacteria bacterium]|jgi:DNA repair protein RadC
MKFTDIPLFDRPREKFISKGASYVTDAELLALIIRSGSKGRHVLEAAGDILNRFSITALGKLMYEDIVAIPGIDTAKACSLMAAIELGKRVYQQAGEKPPAVTQPEDVLILVADIAHRKKEHFVVLYLNARNHLIDREVISIGTVNASIVHPREVFEPAIRMVAAQMILVHNHPSGDPDPSDADIVLTKRLKQVGTIMGIEVADHIIVAGTKYVSLREKGLI